MTGRGTRLLAVLACAAALTSCAVPVGGPTGGAAASAGPGADGSEAWTTYAAEVTGVRPGPVDGTLLVEVSLPDGPAGCARNPRITYYTEENNTIYANVVFDSDRSQLVGGCPATVAATVTLTSATAIGDRAVVLNQQAWALRGAVYGRCPADIGCTPPADHCAAGWTLAAFNGLDVPRHSARTVEHCDQTWLIMKVDVNSAACGAGGRPGCSAPPSVTRYFLRFRNGWEQFAQTRKGGCDAVGAADPIFPEGLCRDLTPTG